MAGAAAPEEGKAQVQAVAAVVPAGVPRVKELPILFSGPMVRALLEGRKTQTRRVLRPQPHEDLANTVHYDRATGGAMWSSIRGDHGVACPYGKPGDRLWVRETWMFSPVGKFALVDMPIPKSLPENWTVLYQSTGDNVIKPLKWKPGIHMPRWASRITLEVVSVRVEQLQDISEEDAIAEGVAMPIGHCCYSARESYHTLWESINGPGSWEANPWLWCVEFRQLHRDGSSATAQGIAAASSEALRGDTAESPVPPRDAPNEPVNPG